MERRKDVIDDAISVLRQCYDGTDEDVLARLPQMERLLNVLRYQCTAKLGWTAEPPREREIHALRCSIEGCHEAPPYYNVAAQHGGTVIWRCRNHIPPEITFPIGLHGAEFEAWQAGKVKK